MKSLFYLSLLLLLVTSCQSKYNDHKALNLKGQVKELLTKRYRAVEKFGEVTKGELVRRRIEKMQLHDYEGLPSNSKVNFDEQGNMVELVSYDEDNYLVIKTLLKDTVFQSYDRSGALISKVIGNDRWFPSEINIYDEEGALVQKTKATYDKGNQLNRVLENYDKEGNWISTVTYQYNPKGYLLQVKKDENPYKNYYGMYNKAEGNLKTTVESLLYEQGNYPSRVTIEEDGDLKIIDITYVLDEQGNWIESIESIDGKPEYFIERKLVYY